VLSAIIQPSFKIITYKGVLSMGQPKKQSSPRLELARRVNAKSPVKARTTRKETGKTLIASLVKKSPVAEKVKPARTTAK
jgi:hypothetical protein